MSPTANSPWRGATTDDITYEINPKSLMVSGAESDMESLSEISLGSVTCPRRWCTNTFTFPIDLDASLENGCHRQHQRHRHRHGKLA